MQVAPLTSDSTSTASQYVDADDGRTKGLLNDTQSDPATVPVKIEEHATHNDTNTSMTKESML